MLMEKAIKQMMALNHPIQLSFDVSSKNSSSTNYRFTLSEIFLLISSGFSTPIINFDI